MRKRKILRSVRVPSAGDVCLSLVLEAEAEELESYGAVTDGRLLLMARTGQADEREISDLRMLDDHLRQRGGSLADAMREQVGLLLPMLFGWQQPEGRVVIELASHRLLYDGVPREVEEPKITSERVEFWLVAKWFYRRGSLWWDSLTFSIAPAMVPTVQEYTAATNPADLRALQERIGEAWLGQLESASSFQDFSTRAQRLALGMRSLGYEVGLFDEDAESMIIHEVSVDGDHGFIIQAFWDPEEGSSICCTFDDR